MYHRKESSISIDTGVSVRSRTPTPVNLPSEAECPRLILTVSGESSPTEKPEVSVGSRTEVPIYYAYHYWDFITSRRLAEAFPIFRPISAQHFSSVSA